MAAYDDGRDEQKTPREPINLAGVSRLTASERIRAARAAADEAARATVAAEIAEHETTARRTVLVHLNLQVRADDPRTAEQIADAVLATIEVGNDPGSDDGLSLSLGDVTVTAPLAEEI